MNKPSASLYHDDETRCHKLNSLIDEIFGHLSIDEIEALPNEYERSETRMFEIVRVSSRSCRMRDLYEDMEFKPVLFPEQLIPLLKKHDVFLATIGFKNSAWTVLHLNPSYTTEYVGSWMDEAQDSVQ